MSLQAFQVSVVPYVHNGFVMPTENVATKDRGACVQTGKNRKGLLYSTMSLADAERNEYTSHPFKEGDIIIQLGQPYYIGSIRLLLRDTDNRTYRFYVQTSLDNINWTMAVDMRNRDMNSSSESVFMFTLRLVVYVKIVGTESSNTADEVCKNCGRKLLVAKIKFFTFHQVFDCVRFECPAKPAAELMDVEE